MIDDMYYEFRETNSSIFRTQIFETKISARNVDPFYAPTASTSKRVPVMTTVIDISDSSDSEPESIRP